MKRAIKPSFKLRLAAAIAFAVAAMAPAGAVPAALPQHEAAPLLQAIPVSGGCGPYGWRDPWGYCRGAPYYGPYGGGYYRPPPYAVWSCPPGYWRGPWGHCRNTPFRGRLPGGGYVP